MSEKVAETNPLLDQDELDGMPDPNEPEEGAPPPAIDAAAIPPTDPEPPKDPPADPPKDPEVVDPPEPAADTPKPAEGDPPPKEPTAPTEPAAQPTLESAQPSDARAEVTTPEPAQLSTPAAIPFRDEPVQQAYIPPPPKDYETRRANLTAQIGDLAEQYDAADSGISPKEYAQKTADLQSELNTLDQGLARHRDAVVDSEQQSNDAWGRVMNPFFDYVKGQDGTDYQNPETFDQLPRAIEFVAGTRAATGKPAGTYGGLLIEAHNLLRSQRGQGPLTAKAPTAATNTPAPPATPPAPRVAPPAPPTLAHLPSATGASEQVHQGVSNKFDYIDQLDGNAADEAFARLSESEREEYLGRDSPD